MIRFVFVCWLAALLPRIVGAENPVPWPCFRGPNHDNHTAAKLPIHWSETKGIVWKTPIQGRGWSSPVVWGNQIWLTTASEDGKKMWATCLAAESGEIVHNRAAVRECRASLPPRDEQLCISNAGD